MKWIAGISVSCWIIYAIYSEGRDGLYLSPFSGFLTGLIFFWIVRAVYRRYRAFAHPGKPSSDKGIGTVLFSIGCIVAAFYFGMAIFASKEGYGWEGYLFFVAFGAITLGISEAVRRAYSRGLTSWGSMESVRAKMKNDQ